MDDNRREYLKRLDIRKINDYGRYCDFENTNMFTLSMEDIRFLRAYYNNKNIAYNIELPERRIEPRRPQANDYRVISKNATPQVRRVSRPKVTRNQKYNKSGYRFKALINNVGKKIIVAGVVVCIGVGMFQFIAKPQEPAKPVDGAHLSVSETLDYSDYNNEYMGTPTVPEIDEYDEEVVRADFIRQLCNIFQVDYRITYSKLVEMTDNFSDPEYLDGKIDKVSCKGFEVDADSEEELLIYAVRVIAQDPNRVGLSEREVCINNGYESGTDYAQMIADWGEKLGVNPALAYAIVRAETSFRSELFLEGNNPAGLKLGSGFWKFPNKEAGIIELMMEIVKYNHMGAYTIEEIGRIHCPTNDPEDVNGNNRNWVRNVTEGYEDALEMYGQMGIEIQNNGLSH